MSERDDPSSGSTPPPPPPPAPGAPTPPPYGAPPPPAGEAPPTQQYGPAAHPGGRPQDRFFAAIRRSGLQRSERRIVGGVSGGIAQRTGIDITVVRVLTVVLTIFGGLGLLAYGLAWLFLPEPDGRIHAEQVLRGDVSAGAVGGIITTVAGFGGLGGGWHGPFGWHGNSFFGWFWGLSGTALFVGLVALVIYAVGQSRHRPPSPPSGPPPGPATASGTYPAGAAQSAYRSGSQPPYSAGAATMTMPAPTQFHEQAVPATPPPRRRASFGGFGALAVAGLAVIGAGVTALIMSNGSYAASTAVMAWSVALAVIAAALVVGGLAGRRAGVVSLFAVVATIGTLLAMVPANMSHLQGAGDRTWRPLTAQAAHDGYGVGAGDGTLDLSAIDRTTLSTADPTKVSASVGFGRLTILVPPDLTVRVKSSAGAGELSLLVDANDTGDDNGVGVHRTDVIGTGAVQLVVDANVGFGRVRIEQVSP